MPDAITFDSIPLNVRTPGAYVEIANTGAVKGLPGMPSRILVLGQRLSTGTAAADTPVRVLDARQAEGLFGRGSMLHAMFAALKAANNHTETWAIALDDDGAGQAATGTLTFAGVVTAAGTLTLYIGGSRVRVAVAVSDSPADIAAAVAAAITAAAALPVTAAVNGGTPEQVDVTARHKGEAGTAIDLRANYHPGETLPAGLQVTVGAMADGTANPDLTAAIAALGDVWYTDIAMPYTDAASLSALEAELASRFGAMVAMDAHAWAAAAGTHAALTALGNSRSSPHLSILGAKASPTPPWAWAAALAGIGAAEAQRDPARPIQRLVLPGILPPAEADRFTQTERNLLLFDGIATWIADAGGRVVVERVVTTYETDAAGGDDPSYLDVETLKTLAYLRYSLRARIGQRFPRFKLADDGTPFRAGQAITTPRRIRAEIVALAREWAEVGLVEDVAAFEAALIVERSQTDPNRVNALLRPDIVNQLRVFAGRIQFLL